MTCAELEALLCDYVDGTLDGERKAAVEKHLAECATCAEMARDASTAVAFMKRVPLVEPPAELVTRLLFQIPTRAEGRKEGFRSFLGRWIEPVLQPRFAMGMAMTILSFSLLARFVGIPDQHLRPSDLSPAAVWETVDNRFHRTWDRAVKYYESLRVVYEIQSRLSEWSEEDQAPTEKPGVPATETQSPEDFPAGNVGARNTGKRSETQ